MKVILTPPGLTMLPPEVLWAIVVFLNAKDLGSLRLACKNIEAKLFIPFAKNSFHHFQVMRTDFSLQTLINISESRFGPYLKQVILGTELLETEFEHLIRSNNRGKDTSQMRTRTDAPVILMQDEAKLVKAFQKLRLEAVGIRDYQQPRIRVQRRRPHHPLRHGSYGFPTFMKDWRLPPAAIQYLPRRNAHNEDVSAFQIILNALGKANATPKSLITIIDCAVGLQQAAFQIPVAIEAKVWPVIAKLEKVHLEINGAESTGSLVDFLRRANHLQSLSLNFVVFNEAYGEIFKWLASDDGCVCHRDFPVVQLLHLDLQNANISTQNMITLVHKLSKTLLRLTLSDIRLTTVITDSKVGSFNPHLSPWENFLDALLFADRLQSLHISGPVDCVQGTESLSTRVREFCNDGHTFSSIYYSGPGMKRALEGFKYSLVADGTWEPYVEEIICYSNDVCWQPAEDNW